MYRQMILDSASRAQAIAHIRSLPFDAPQVLTIKRWRRTRSVQQNKLYWMWLGVLSDTTGHNVDELHEYFKAKFLLPVDSSVCGETVSYTTTTNLDTAQMTTYLDTIRQFAIDQLDTVLPLPDDIGWNNFVLNYDTTG